MTLTNTSRKRECSDESEYLPVTKRMNNLHIDASSNELNESGFNGHQMNGFELPLEISDGLNCQQNQSHNRMNGVHSSNSFANYYNASKTYSPELDSNENPLYYEPNRILFEAHQQRILRTHVNNRNLFNKKT